MKEQIGLAVVVLDWRTDDLIRVHQLRNDRNRTAALAVARGIKAQEGNNRVLVCPVYVQLHECEEVH